MRLKVDGVDHQTIGLPALGGELSEDPVEHAQAAPADEAIIYRLMRAITGKLMDVSRLKDMGWAPTVGREEGVEEAYRWFLENVEAARL